jgi:hypothetical protein
MRKDDRGRGFEAVGLRENLHLDKVAVGLGINGVDVTAGSTEVADPGAHARAGIFRKDLGQSDERKSGCAKPLFFHGIAFSGTLDILYRPAAEYAGNLPALASRARFEPLLQNTSRR